MTKLAKLFINSLTHFFYPTFCTHCNRQIYGRERWICKPCFEQIEWIDSTLACKTCGKPKRERVRAQCSVCHVRPTYVMPMVSCFYPEGPAWALHEQLRVYESEEIAKLFASLLVMKWKELPWPFPEAIIPVPDSRIETFSLKNQANYLVAKAFSRLIAAPFRPVLTTEERGTSFGYRPKSFFRGNVTDKKVLLITDVVHDSDSLRFARDAVQSLFPKSICTIGLFDWR